MKKTLIICCVGIGLVIGLVVAGEAFKRNIDPYAKAKTLPTNRTFGISEVRKQMTVEELRIDQKVRSGRLVLPDGRPVTTYQYQKKNNLLIGGASPVSKISISKVDLKNSGREVQVLFLNEKKETFAPLAKDIGAWKVKGNDFQAIGNRLADVANNKKQLAVSLIVDKSGSMRAFMPKVKEAAKHFLSAVPAGTQCSIVSFNQLTTVHAGVEFHYVDRLGKYFDDRVRDVAPEHKRTDFVALYPEAIIERKDQGNVEKLKDVFKAGNWGVDCSQGGPYVDQIGEASGGTALFQPLSLALRTAQVGQTIPEFKGINHIIVLISDGGASYGWQKLKDEVVRLKEATQTKVFLYWIGRAERSAIAGIPDFEMVDQKETQTALKAYLDNIRVFLDGHQILILNQ